MLIEKNEFGVKPPTEQIKHEERLRGIKNINGRASH